MLLDNSTFSKWEATGKLCLRACQVHSAYKLNCAKAAKTNRGNSGDSLSAFDVVAKTAVHDDGPDDLIAGLVATPCDLLEPVHECRQGEEQKDYERHEKTAKSVIARCSNRCLGGIGGEPWHSGHAMNTTKQTLAAGKIATMRSGSPNDPAAVKAMERAVKHAAVSSLFGRMARSMGEVV